MNRPFDVLVIGGGPAGSTSALLLARAGLNVALVESKPFPRRKVCGEFLSATNWPLLHDLGIFDQLMDCGGAAGCKVGLFAGSSITTAELPPCRETKEPWGRAIGREILDTFLLRQAMRAGVFIRQPWSAVEVRHDGESFLCKAVGQDVDQTEWLRTRIIIAAHGSWNPGALPTQPHRCLSRAGDLLAFKAHFRGADLPEELMPLLAFPGGYGGMVRCEQGRVNLSCCIRRDVLHSIRGGETGSAGDALLNYILCFCTGARRALRSATRDGSWLAAGPIRPGTRLHTPRGIFAVGNAAGKAHPAIAEGISMALQSAVLLTRRLATWHQAGGVQADLSMAAAGYRQSWRRAFGPRLVASSLIANWAMHPRAVDGVLPAVRRFPTLLTWGARWSGKAQRVFKETHRKKAIIS